MEKFIQRIISQVPFSTVKVDIVLNGRSLVITGGNGSGKTRLLDRIHDMLSRYMDNSLYFDESFHHKKLAEFREQLKFHSKGGDTHRYLLSEISDYKNNLSILEKTKIELLDRPRKLHLSKNTKSLLRMYPADRKAKIQEPNSVLPLNRLIQEEFDRSYSSNAGEQFENYLVSYRTLQSHLIALVKDISKANLIELWFKKIESDFKELFEDEGLTFKFDIEDQRFYFHQIGQEPYTLQTLSAGYSAIMSIYADLIMKVQLQEIAPQNLRGIVLIDEIDAHLHVSLQKKIFRFLTKSFPEIQFIITTHSPFVIMSVNDIVMYDIAKQDYIEDVSLYSYEAVVEGIFDVLPISKILEEKIKILAELTNDPDSSTQDIISLLSQIKPMEDKLDGESGFFLARAEFELTKRGRTDV
jgi:predicted ATP-binding protein involved in virulence